MLQISIFVLGAVGMVLVAAGVLYIMKGMQGKAEITGELEYEGAKTGRETPAPGLPIVDAKTARMESDLIKHHLYENSKQRKFVDFGRDDPERDYILKGMTIRNSLGMAILGLGVSQLAMGTGALVILIGGGFLSLSVSLGPL